MCLFEWAGALVAMLLKSNGCQQLSRNNMSLFSSGFLQAACNSLDVSLTSVLQYEWAESIRLQCNNCKVVDACLCVCVFLELWCDMNLFVRSHSWDKKRVGIMEIITFVWRYCHSNDGSLKFGKNNYIWAVEHFPISKIACGIDINIKAPTCIRNVRVCFPQALETPFPQDFHERQSPIFDTFTV